jgi:pilus assembly protein CpaF
MFSRYKKEQGGAATAPRPQAAGQGSDTAMKPVGARVDDTAPKQQAAMRKPAPAKAPAQTGSQDKSRKRKERLGEIKLELHRALLDNLNLAALDTASEQDLRLEINSIATEVLQEKGIVLNREERTTLNQELYDEVKGLGPLESLLKDETVSDILVNGPQQIFVERNGKLELSDVVFKDEKHLLRIIDKIVSAVGRRVDESNPYVDARLADGARFNAMVPPIAVDGSLVSIRKFKKDKLGIDDLVQFGAFNEEMAAYLQAAVACRLNIIVSGGTGSGKTTTLNALSSFIDNAERILTIEHTAELQLQQIHVGRMESRPPNVEG